MKVLPIRPNQPHRTPTVLIVEDDRPVQEVLQRWLAESGRNAVACGTFEEAKAYLAFHTPDVLITDVRLQNYNGLQLVLFLMDKQPAVPCLVLTGYDDPVLRREAEHLHARYLLKPLERDDFLAAIDNLSTSETLARTHASNSRKSAH
jgi:DNA-binding NtrC family response regulator